MGGAAVSLATAVPVPSGPDAGAPWHYGDPVAEQRTWLAARGAVDLSARGVVRVGGADRLSWLDSLTSQRLVDLAPGVATETLLLSPHGHVELALHVVDDATTTWLTTEAGSAPALVEFLDRMRFLLDVTVQDVSGEFAVVGEPSRDPVAPAGGVVWVDPWPVTAPGGAAYGPPDDDHPGRDWAHREVLLPREEAAQRLAAHIGDGTAVGLWAWEALRVAAARPRQGFETDHRTIPHEVDWLRTAVHLSKGCYRGQETVARVHNLGHPPRRLVLLQLDGSQAQLPSRHDAVHTAQDPDGRPVGLVTTPARHHELGPVALALVRRSLPLDTVLVAGGVAAAQEELVAP